MVESYANIDAQNVAQNVDEEFKVGEYASEAEEDSDLARL